MAEPVPVRLLGISGSLQRNSANRRLLVATRGLLPPFLRLEIFDGLKSVEPFDEDDEAAPPAGAIAFREALAAVDGVVIATPEYNSTLPGQLKNALDWASRPRATSVLIGKPVLVIGASPSRFGALRAQEQVRSALRASGADAADLGFALADAFAQFDAGGALRSEIVQHELSRVLGGFGAHLRNTPTIAPGRPGSSAA